MKKEILRCVKCYDYTFKKICSVCNSECITTKPAKFSLDDKFGKYRRVYKEKIM